MKKLLLLGVSLFSVPVSSFAFNADEFAIHLRKALSLDSRTEIKVSSAVTPAGFGDMMVVNATLGGAPYPVYMTKDEKKYIWGFVVDATTDPDKSREQQISLKNAHVQGSATAPITIVEYSDLQCGHCKMAHETIKKELYKTYKKEQVRFIFKHFPLNGHDWAEPASVAAECASSQKESAFWDVIDYFFANQEKVKKDDVKAKSLEAIKDLKLDTKKFESCLDSTPPLEKVRADKKEGLAVGVSSTPTLYINGRSRRGFRDFQDIKVVVDEKLADQKK